MHSILSKEFSFKSSFIVMKQTSNLHYFSSRVKKSEFDTESEIKRQVNVLKQKFLDKKEDFFGFVFFQFEGRASKVVSSSLKGDF
jgi:hypothetical protein